MVFAKIVILLAATLLISALLQGCGGGGGADESSTIPGIAGNTAQLSTLVTALKTAGLVSTLEGTGPFTVFAPTNDAFNALPFKGAELTYLLHNKDKLTEVLEYHVTAGDVMSGDLKNGQEIKMLAGGNVTVTITDTSGKATVMINNATVKTADVKASNGIVHIIDQVLIPEKFTAPNIPEVATSHRGGQNTNLKTLVQAVTKAGLGAALSDGPLTVFAPTDAAFAALPDGVLEKLLLPANIDKLKQVLLYHVHSGEVVSSELANGEKVTTLEGKNLTVVVGSGGVTVNGKTGNSAKVTQADVFAVNGVVHVIDAVLLPSDFVPPTSTKENVLV